MLGLETLVDRVGLTRDVLRIHGFDVDGCSVGWRWDEMRVRDQKLLTSWEQIFLFMDCG